MSRVVSVGRWSVWRQSALDYLEQGADQDAPALRILELGFGTGELLRTLAQRGFAVTGLEPSAAMHRVSARKLQRARLKLSLVQGVAEAAPFADATFDRIISTFPAAYILDERTLQACARLLTDNGLLIIVGLWVRLQPRWLERFVPLFYGEPAPEQKMVIAERLAKADFVVDWVEHIDGPFAVTVLLGCKAP